MIVIPKPDNGYVRLIEAYELHTKCYVIIYAQLSLNLREVIAG